MDIRLWNRELITDFIEMYKAYPCLWKVKAEVYKNRNLRDEAYNKLIDFCKQRGFPDANRDFVVKKIQSLRGSFRKELKKVIDSQRSGSGREEIYISSLWYYDNLLFTKEQETPTESISNIDTLEEDDVDKQDNTTEEHIQTGNESVLQKKNDSTTSSVKQGRKRKSLNFAQAEFLDVCTATLKANNKEFSEFDATGINVAKKLAKMEPTQAIYAESLINNVLRSGLLKCLTENSDFCNNGCKLRRSETPSSVVSFTTIDSGDGSSMYSTTPVSTHPQTQLHVAEGEQGTTMRSFYEDTQFTLLN